MRRRRLPLFVATGLVGFLVVAAVGARPSADPASRVPRRFQLAALIEREQVTADRLRRDVAALREAVDRLAATGGPNADAAPGATAAPNADATTLDAVRTAAGVRAVRGAALEVVLDDSDLGASPTGDPADLVIHSQDVQAVVNAVWRAGAEAVAINGERLVSTSAVLCVGNTLLLNGTVHSPPYRVVAIGASRERFQADALVRRLDDDADALGLRFSVSSAGDVTVPAYRGLTVPRHARPSAAGAAPARR